MGENIYRDDRILYHCIIQKLGGENGERREAGKETERGQRDPVKEA